MWLTEQPLRPETAPNVRRRRYRTIRLNLPSTHVPLFHAWRP